MNRLWKGICALTIVGATMGNQIADAAGRITVKGSDTLVILAQRWAETYMKKTPRMKIQVTGGGSGTGIAALINGTTDICNSSRALKNAEITRVQQRWKKVPYETKCAKDGITIYAHKSNPVPSLTLQQLSDLYTGKVSNWKQVGGKDMKITRYSRENNSGTYVFFKEHVMKKQDYHSSCQNMPGTAAIVNAVAKDATGIGYGGAAYAKGIKVVPVKADSKSAACTPTAANVKSGKYPISRYLFMYTRGAPTGVVKKYVDWCLSSEGQKIVSQVGYFPVK